MKKKLNGVLVTGLVCIGCFLCTTVVYASMGDGKSDRSKKLIQIEECDQKIEQLQDGTSYEDKEELEKVLDKKMQLEIETDTYAYDRELEVSINSVNAAVEDTELFYDQETIPVPKSEKKRLRLLKQLCEEYKMKSESCTESEEYKELLEQFRMKTDTINQKYR